jgi:hypothetical protein
MTEVEQIFETIRRLPVRDRLRLVERVVHELADTSSTEDRVEPPATEPSPLGLFADDPDEVDEMMKIVAENRRRWKLRSVGGEDEQGPA